MLDVRFKVQGRPVPKGNMAGFPVSRVCKLCATGKPCGKRTCVGGIRAGVAVTDKGDRELDAWQDLVYFAGISARNAAGARLIESPLALAVDLVFVMPRAESHWNGSKLSRAGQDRKFPTTKPDLDKLTRTILDGLRGALAEDDAQVTLAKLAEVYAPAPRAWTGVCVHARQVETVDAWVEHELAYHGLALQCAVGR